MVAIKTAVNNKGRPSNWTEVHGVDLPCIMQQQQQTTELSAAENAFDNC
jgi:hypothetical protein